MFNHYGRFVPALSTTAHPLNNLLQHNVQWKWSKECQVAFCKLKIQLSSQPVLVHYNSSLPLILACDASQYGVVAVIAHAMPDGSEKPVAFGSRTLSKAEENYPQIEKEALGIVYGVKKFHQYVYVRTYCRQITNH